MGLFDFFRKKPGAPQSDPEDAKARKRLANLVLEFVKGKDGRIRVEDALSASATVVGERCIEASGDYALREHDMKPGARVFSTRANELICGDKGEGGVAEVPADSIIGILRGRLDPKLYSDADFPSLPEVFRQYAARIGKGEEWGKVPLSVGKDNLPYVQPLRVGYETRPVVDEILKPMQEDRMRCLRVATGALADILNMVAGAIERKLALMIAIETVNGMAKTAPMTKKAFEAAQRDSAKEQ